MLIARAVKRPTFWIYPYAIHSVSARLLATALGAKLVRTEGSKYRQQPSDILINWGSSRGPDGSHPLNSYESVGCATSKLGTFRELAAGGVRTPDWTESKAQAEVWVSRGRLLGRDLDRGSQGRGITVYERDASLGDHKFYVRVMKKDREFRLHVFKGRVFWVQEKLRKRGVEVDKVVRSHNRGWCFAFQHLGDNPPPASAYDVAVNAVKALRLDFGAVDLGWSEGTGCTVFEVNTAPGIEDSTLFAYADVFQSLLGK